MTSQAHSSAYKDVLLQAQEERAHVAHQVYQGCRKQRDDAVKAGATLAHSLSVANQVAEEAVNRSAASDQEAKVALKDNKVLYMQLLLQSSSGMFCGTVSCCCGVRSENTFMILLPCCFASCTRSGSHTHNHCTQKRVYICST